MIRYLLSIIIIMVVFSGCSSYLDKLPDDRTLINTPNKVRELLVSAYSITGYSMFTEQMSDNVEDKGQWPVVGAWSPLQQEQAYYWEDITDERQDTPPGFWTYTYGAIAAANAALEAIEELGDTEEYQVYKGEALMARAYNHFMLVNIFAEHYNPATAETDLGITYMSEPETEALVMYERQSVKEIYDLIEKDILEGIDLVEDRAAVVPRYHFNTSAANAFAARYYLYRGDAWDKVIEYTTRILGGHRMVHYYYGVIQNGDTTYREGDVYISQFADQLRDYPNVYSELLSNPDDYANQYCSVDEPANLMLINYASLGWRASFVSRYGLDLNTRNAIFTQKPFSDRLLYGEFGSSPNFTLYKTRENFVYSTPGGTSGMAYNVNVEFSVEEAVLNRAEAYVMKEQYEEVLADLNTFISKRISDYTLDMTPYRITDSSIMVTYAGKIEDFPDLQPYYSASLTEKQQTYLKCITDFRRKEFCQEGKRWFDIKRFHLTVTHTPYGSNIPRVLTGDDPRRAIQIPEMATSHGYPKNPR